MTAAEKRKEAVNVLLELTGHVSGQVVSHSAWLKATVLSNLLTFTDDEPATPAQEPDWRDEVVSWGTGWEKRFEPLNPENKQKFVLRGDGITSPMWWVFEDGSGSPPIYDNPNNDPLSRCRAIDRFLSELAGEGVK